MAKEYEVAFKVVGNFYVTVEANSHAEAKVLAEQAFSDADFGALENIDGDCLRTELYEDGNWVEEKEYH